ncbi:SAV_915 family protein [Streptomyces sp. NPDC051684]|uniref:SAV_915 family protein n=1 Tax=Streptomyces sp. NPDC051684 TaxID=3365670 RepID=UPI00378F3CD1
MAQPVSDEDPERSERFTVRPLHVPVRPSPFGYAARLFRTPLGDRTAVGFTSARALTATLGAGQPWIRLAEPALRDMTAPLGAATVTVDPQLSAPAPVSRPPHPARNRRASDTPRGVAIAALGMALSYWIG